MAERPHVLLSRVLEIETALCSALQQRNDKQLKEVLNALDSILQTTRESNMEKADDREVWVSILCAMRRSQAIASTSFQLEKNLTQCWAAIRQEVGNVVQGRDIELTSMRLRERLLNEWPAEPLIPSEEKTLLAFSRNHDEQSLNAVVMRRWMLAHIDHPFPTTQDKEMIAEETNRGATDPRSQLRPEQATLWFINTRRRSGWTSWARRFANSDKTRLRAIVAAIQGRQLTVAGVKGDEIEDSLEELVEAKELKDRELSKSELATLCKTEFAKVTDWIEQGSKERVGNWMDKVVAEAKATLKRKRKERRAARKLLVERRRGRAAAAMATRRSAKTDDSEEEGSPEGQPNPRARHNPRPIRQLPQRRHVSGGSSASSSLSSMVSGRPHCNAQSSSSAATSFDSAYERSASIRPPPPIECSQSESPEQVFDRMEVCDDDRPKLDLLHAPPNIGPSPPLSLSRLPYYPAAVYQCLGMPLQDPAHGQQQAPLMHPAVSESTAPTCTVPEKCMGNSREPLGHESFFMPSVTAAAALSSNWGMPAAALPCTSNEMVRQTEEIANYGGWLAWSGQLTGGEA